MPTFDVTFTARYANNEQGHDTYKIDNEPDIGRAIQAAFVMFVDSEMDDGRSSPIGLNIEANQR